MDAATAKVWSQIQALPLNDPLAEQTYTARLAKENGWRMDYTRRVVEEYRKFLLLAKVAGHAVSPPDSIDQAWHLHILYTRSYWEDLCQNVLGFRLHHEPSRGGMAEREKFAGLYAKTLESYAKIFGNAPPADIWPSPQALRQMHSDFQRVNKLRYWLIPRISVAAWLRRRGWIWSPFALVAILPLSLFGMNLNIFDWTGPSFLLLYAILLVVGFACSLFLRWMALGQSVDLSLAQKELTPDEVAYLSGGPENCLAAALGTLVRTGQLQVQAGTNAAGKTVQYVVLGTNPGEVASDMQEKMLRAVKSAGQYELTELKRDMLKTAEESGELLQSRGLVYSAFAMTMAQILGAIPMLIVLGIGFIKFAMGISRGKPIIFLMFLFGGGAILLVFAVMRKFRTSAGDKALNDLRTEHATLEKSIPENTSAPAYDTGLALGLFGLGMFHTGPGSELNPYFHTPYRKADGSWQSYDSGTSCGTSCGGVDGGGGDGGGGDGGGGGCGSGCGGCGGGGGD